MQKPQDTDPCVKTSFPWKAGGTTPPKMGNLQYLANFVRKKFPKDSPEAPGLVLEFGVYEGQSLCELVCRFGPGYLFFGFDSFQGLPEAGRDLRLDWHVGRFKSTLEETTKRIEEALEEDAANVHLVPGFYADSLTTETADQVGLGRLPLRLVHVDCDLYSSTITVLRFLAPFFCANLVLLFDEWFPEEHVAWEDFCALPTAPSFRCVDIELPFKTEQKAIMISKASRGC